MGTYARDAIEIPAYVCQTMPPVILSNTTLTIDRPIYRRAGEGRMKKEDLMELTGQESGIIIYDEKEVIICNWQGVNGLPRLDPIGYGIMGLGEEIVQRGRAKNVRIWPAINGKTVIYDRNDDYTLIKTTRPKGTLYHIDGADIIAPDGWN